jgi:hypothetical protein
MFAIRGGSCLELWPMGRMASASPPATKSRDPWQKKFQVRLGIFAMFVHHTHALQGGFDQRPIVQ